MDGAAMLYILFAICAGAATTLQNSINGLMTPIIGSMCVSCINFTVQAILILGYLAIFQRRLPAVRRVPLPYYASGILATIVVGLIGMCVSRMSSAVTTCCSVAGQILMSALIDHFGLFGAQRVRFHLSRAPGFLCILAGVLCINLIGQICAGVVLDLMIFHALTWEKAIGVAMIVLGVMIDKLAVRHTPAI